jgi:hypothetical protein
MITRWFTGTNRVIKAMAYHCVHAYIWGCPVWCGGPWVAVFLHGRHLRLLLVMLGRLGRLDPCVDELSPLDLAACLGMHVLILFTCVAGFSSHFQSEAICNIGLASARCPWLLVPLCPGVAAGAPRPAHWSVVDGACVPASRATVFLCRRPAA